MINAPNVSALIFALRTDDRRTHTLVVDDLVKIGSAAVGPLLHALDDSVPTVRSGAARALGKIGDARALAALIFRLRYDIDAEVRKNAAWALRMGGSQAVDALGDALGDEDEWVRFGASVVLAKIGQPALRPLITALHHQSILTRANAAEALGRIGDRRAANALARMLTDDPFVSFQAAVSLGRIGDARAVPQLVEIVRRNIPELAAKAIKALGQVKDVRAVDTLIDIVNSQEDRWMRLFAIEALGRIGDMRAIEVLVDAAYEDSRDLRTKAIVTLAEIDFPLALDALDWLADDPDLDQQDRHSALFELGKRGDARAFDGLAKLLLEEEDAETRMYAAFVLGEMAAPEAVPLLITAAAEDIPEVSGHAMKALVKMGHRATSTLIDVLGATLDHEHRLWAVRALGAIADMRAIAMLTVVALSADEAWWIQQEARQILSRLGHDPQEPI